MKIEKMKSGAYRVRQQSEGKRICITFPYKPSQREFAIAVAERLQEANRKQAGTFIHCAEEYINNRSNVLSPASITTYKRYTKMISNTFNSKRIYDITQDDIQAEINLFAETHEPKTTRSLHGFIAAVIKAKRPTITIKTSLPQNLAKKNYLPTEDDIKKILNHVEGTIDEIPIKLGIMSLRRAEICALTLEDFTDNSVSITKAKVYDIDKKWVIKYAPKNDTSIRTVVLAEDLVKKVRAQGSIFPYTPPKLNEHLHSIQDELGIPRFRFHLLRHYFASYAHAIGIPDADILAIGGWKTDHVMKSVYRESMEKTRQESNDKLISSIF